MKLRVVLRGGEVDREAKIVKMVEGFAPPFDEFRILFLYHAIQSNPPPPPLFPENDFERITISYTYHHYSSRPHRTTWSPSAKAEAIQKDITTLPPFLPKGGISKQKYPISQ